MLYCSSMNILIYCNDVLIASFNSFLKYNLILNLFIDACIVTIFRLRVPQVLVKGTTRPTPSVGGVAASRTTFRRRDVQGVATLQRERGDVSGRGSVLRKMSTLCMCVKFYFFSWHTCILSSLCTYITIICLNFLSLSCPLS